MKLSCKQSIAVCFFIFYVKLLRIGATLLLDTNVYKIEKNYIAFNESENLSDIIESNNKMTQNPYSLKSHSFSIHSTLGKTHKVHTTNTTIHHNHKKELDYRIWITIPVGVILFVILIVILGFFIRRRIRKRQLQREFLPQYAYDHSEAEIFDGYTQYPDVNGSVERLVHDNFRSKTPSPESIDKTDISVDVATITNGCNNKAEDSTSKVI